MHRLLVMPKAPSKSTATMVTTIANVKKARNESPFFLYRKISTRRPAPLHPSRLYEPLNSRLEPYIVLA